MNGRSRLVEERPCCRFSLCSDSHFFCIKCNRFFIFMSTSGHIQRRMLPEGPRDRPAANNRAPFTCLLIRVKLDPVVAKVTPGLRLMLSSLSVPSPDRLTHMLHNEPQTAA